VRSGELRSYRIAHSVTGHPDAPASADIRIANGSARTIWVSNAAARTNAVIVRPAEQAPGEQAPSEQTMARVIAQVSDDRCDGASIRGDAIIRRISCDPIIFGAIRRFLRRPPPDPDDPGQGAVCGSARAPL
jgi:hypothetical protein